MSKKVNQFSTNGELLKTYKSLAEAARNVGVNPQSIKSVCDGYRKSCRGFLWGFENETKKMNTGDEIETWRDIKGFEGQYEMSDKREVRTKDKTITVKKSNGDEYQRIFPCKIIKTHVDNEGYLSVCLKGKKYRVHWLFYNTFIGDSTGYLIDHIDRNRQNNDPSNLRLADPKLNVANRTLPYRPDIRYDYRCSSHPYQLRFSYGGERKSIGYYSTYEEAENKYRELYNERQKTINELYSCN